MKIIAHFCPPFIQRQNLLLKNEQMACFISFICKRINVRTVAKYFHDLNSRSEEKNKSTNKKLLNVSLLRGRCMACKNSHFS